MSMAFVQYAFLKLKARTLLVFAQPQRALHVFENIMQLRPHDSHALASCAHLHAANHDFPRAIACLTALVQSAPDASAFFNLAYVLQQAGLQREAEAAFRQAIAQDERMDRAWYGLGLALVHRKQFEEAAGAFKRATVLQPLSPHPWYRLAEVCMALGRHGEARDVLLHLKQFEPKVAAQLERQAFAAGHTCITSHAAH